MIFDKWTNRVEPSEHDKTQSLFPSLDSPFFSAFLSILLTSLLGAFFFYLTVHVSKVYGWALFVYSPLALAFFSSMLYSYNTSRSLSSCMKIAFGSIGFILVLLLLWKMEGIICIAMASPIIALLGFFGAWLGHKFQRGGRRQKHSMLMSIALLNPLLTGVERQCQLQPPVQTVRSTVVINAPPNQVWKALTRQMIYGKHEGFLFKAGITYPTSAEIVGVDNHRFLKVNLPNSEVYAPITRYIPQQTLEFSFAQTPEPMKEMSPYKDIHPPHLRGYFNVRKGVFNLRPMPGNRTELSGTTLYQYEIWPVEYWKLWTSFILDRMHLKVLQVVKENVERKRG